MSEDNEIAKVSNKGVVTGVSAGVVAVFVTAVPRDKNYRVYDEEVVTVEVAPEGIDISETKIRFRKSAFTYNGKVQKPVIKTIKGWKLKAGTDYTVKWSNKSSKNAGTYKVTVTGKGGYIGSTDATYTIKKAANPMTLKAKTVKIKRKSLKKGTYKVKVKVKAGGTKNYKPSAWKTVTFRVRVK